MSDRTVYEFELVGGPFDGAPGLRFIGERGRVDPPDRIQVGRCAGSCGLAFCAGRRPHVAYWADGRDPCSSATVEYVLCWTDERRPSAHGGYAEAVAVYAIEGLDLRSAVFAGATTDGHAVAAEEGLEVYLAAALCRAFAEQCDVVIDRWRRFLESTEGDDG